ncbi:MAG: nicotinate phosphoribosyltransferase [Cuniculiplasma sp.]
MENRKFFIATEREIEEGKASDVYFSRTKDLVLSEGDDVVAEITSSMQEKWINFTGLEEVTNLLEGRNIQMWAIPEGTLLGTRDTAGRSIPFIVLKGNYSHIIELETSILGFICQSSGISSESTRVFMECYPKPFMSFGIRRMHPGISPMIDRAAYIGGASGVSGILGAELIGITPSGTMPHSAALMMGEDRAWDYVMKNSPPGSRTILIDTFGDEKFKAIEAAEKFPDIDYIRLDTPSSRRGNFPQIIREVRWELDIRGFKSVKIMVSGGLKKEQIAELREAGVDSFGVGTTIASGKVIDFAMDIVEIGGRAITKKGKLSGMKNVFQCESCGRTTIALFNETPLCPDHGIMRGLLQKILQDGKRINKKESVIEIRERSVNMALKLLNSPKE